MNLWTSQEVRAATGGYIEGDWVVSGISIDTRTLAKGDLFVALIAERDGHDFVLDALGKGAGAALVSKRPEGLSADAPLILVEDVQKALEALGTAARTRSKAKILAITGSVGKTSTKDMLRTVLEKQGRTHASVASYNNHWGVPLTLARMPAETEYGVFEIGMNHPGEIAPLARLVRPDAVLITTVSAAHLEAFESVEAIAAEKASIIEGLSPDGTAVLNADIPTASVLRHVADQTQSVQIWFGCGAVDAQLTVCDTRDDTTYSQAKLGAKDLSYELRSLGSHFALNALGAIAALEAVGADAEKAAKDISLWQPVEGRGSRSFVSTLFGKIEVIDDAYNANPASMAAALEVLSIAKCERRIAILGDMKELGHSAQDIHANLADLASLNDIDAIHLVGPLMGSLYQKLPSKQRGVHVNTAAEMVKIAADILNAGDCILIKASLGTGLGAVVKTILQLEQSQGMCTEKET